MNHPETREPVSLQEVLDSSMCISCGACLAVDPELEMTFDLRTMMFQPDGPGSRAAASVCPSIRVDYDQLHAWRFPGKPVTEHGVVDSVWLAQSTNREQNLGASSGGVIRELLSHLMAQPDLDGVIALVHQEGISFEPTLLREPSDLDQLPGSIYHNLSSHKVLEILEENEGRFALVGIPCQLEGILSCLRTERTDLRERLGFIVGLSCGWYYNHHALHALGTYKGFDPNELDSIQYRGGGPIGKLRAKTTDGREFSVSRRVDVGYQAAFDRSYNLPRCHVCVNHVNFFADIVVADAWLPRTLFSKTGVSLLIARSESATELLKDLGKAGRVRLAPSDVSDIVSSQRRGNAFGDFAYGYASLLRSKGRFCPDLHGPNEQAAQPVSAGRAQRFDLEFQKKRKLQVGKRYRLLLIRKVTLELPSFLGRYFRWFLNRVLGVRKRRDPTERASLPEGFV